MWVRPPGIFELWDRRQRCSFRLVVSGLQRRFFSNTVSSLLSPIFLSVRQRAWLEIKTIFWYYFELYANHIYSLIDVIFLYLLTNAFLAMYQGFLAISFCATVSPNLTTSSLLCLDQWNWPLHSLKWIKLPKESNVKRTRIDFRDRRK